MVKRDNFRSFLTDATAKLPDRTSLNISRFKTPIPAIIPILCNSPFSRLFRRRRSAKEEPATPTYVQEEFADFEANQHLCVLGRDSSTGLLAQIPWDNPRSQTVLEFPIKTTIKKGQNALIPLKAHSDEMWSNTRYSGHSLENLCNRNIAVRTLRILRSTKISVPCNKPELVESRVAESVAGSPGGVQVRRRPGQVGEAHPHLTHPCSEPLDHEIQNFSNHLVVR
ncbi:hypothetical protein CEXT_340301 [Caerostris extrusa]|uniref:Uncharacterized protein n=1 Tax=Caerostris extrusa TaxID=172846 RepID=A0AAV4S4V2_CAEEX|nr:hypothetical protein CEXT_340301 [Caerostris extrusa]